MSKSDAHKSAPRPSSFEAFQRATAALHQRRAEARRAESEPTMLAVRQDGSAAPEPDESTRVTETTDAERVEP